MPDFSVRISQSTGLSGPNFQRLTFPPWIDPPDGENPSRINPLAHVPHRYARWRVGPLETGVVLEISAVVGGVVAPADGALGGRLFSWSVSVGPIGAPWPLLVSPVGGKTSRVQIPTVAAYPGHWRIVCARPGSGSIGIPFDVEAGYL